MRIVTLDLSLTATGVCYPDGSTATISVASKGMQRLYQIRARVLDVVGQGDLVALEGYSYGSKGQAVVNIGELGGAIRLALWERSMPYVEVPPACLKKYACGAGNAPKERVLIEAVHRAGRTFGDNNQADAFWLWCMAMTHYGLADERVPKMPALNLGALEKVPWVEVPAHA